MAMGMRVLSGISAWGLQEGTEATFDKASSDFARCFGICSANSRQLSGRIVASKKTIIVGRWCRRSAMGYAVLQEERYKTCRRT